MHSLSSVEKDQNFMSVKPAKMYAPLLFAHKNVYISEISPV